MTTSRVSTTITLRCPPSELFEFVTTPAHWPAWHPSSLGVDAAADHPLRLGERCEERFRIAGSTGLAVWTVRAYDPPRMWQIVAEVLGSRGGGGTITYMLEPRGTGTRFQRVFIYARPTRVPALLNSLVLRPIIIVDSWRALHRLRHVVEGQRQAAALPAHGQGDATR